jgi:hypothetical protein
VDESTARSTVLELRTPWDGASAQFDTPSLSGTGRFFFSIWAHALEGSSEAARVSISL